MKWFCVDYYKEGYPFKDEYGTVKFSTKEDAYAIKQYYLEKGYQVMIRVVYEED